MKPRIGVLRALAVALFTAGVLVLKVSALSLTTVPITVPGFTLDGAEHIAGVARPGHADVAIEQQTAHRLGTLVGEHVVLDHDRTNLRHVSRNVGEFVHHVFGATQVVGLASDERVNP